ncbi:type I-E CRISPR-associated protein Cse1/CasA [Streptomyces sp. SL13]|uniref:Type I-E CRISPR-associated protein Cse1/CasA n=1 Tax=Streptantibioticus silvisoli TaxID=2705255 RepID=A0AA90K7R9_9ACTN|nr:type I-E CRISPR-associated protein Cse1/CasA [Streptantibioticus silvisoli]MDI5968607.1 type I-E CRISPR-associated protein Cse1/CasA [Streptantibioticus silvisoli]
MESPQAMNLFDEPWIPVRWLPDRDGPGHVGLRDLLGRCQDIEALDIPLAAAQSALLRVLYALTARVTGLDEDPTGDWMKRRAGILKDSALPKDGIEDYVSLWHGRFFLFDGVTGRPWLQDPRLAVDCTESTGVNKLMMTRPSGNNHSWFGHVRDSAPHPPSADAAVPHLLMWHYYGAPGKCTPRALHGERVSEAKRGPLSGSLSYHPEGESLLVTLLAGLVRPGTEVRREEDLCPWERDEPTDPAGAPPVPVGPCGWWTDTSRHALLLRPDARGERVTDAHITWAYRLPGAFDDPYLIWEHKLVKTEEGQQEVRFARSAKANRALWRDLDGLLRHRPPEAEGEETTVEPPKVFATAVELTEKLRVRALGFDQDKAKNTQFVSGLTPATVGHLTDRLADTQVAVGRLRRLGERYGENLTDAVREAWALYTGGDPKQAGKLVPQAEALYWPAAEREFWARFDLLDRTEQDPDGGLDIRAARNAFLQLAQETYARTTDPLTRTVRGNQAVLEARGLLWKTRPKRKKK